MQPKVCTVIDKRDNARGYGVEFVFSNRQDAEIFALHELEVNGIFPTRVRAKKSNNVFPCEINKGHFYLTLSKAEYSAYSQKPKKGFWEIEDDDCRAVFKDKPAAEKFQKKHGGSIVEMNYVEYILSFSEYQYINYKKFQCLDNNKNWAMQEEERRGLVWRRTSTGAYEAVFKSSLSANTFRSNLLQQSSELKTGDQVIEKTFAAYCITYEYKTYNQICKKLGNYNSFSKKESQYKKLLSEFMNILQQVKESADGLDNLTAIINNSDLSFKFKLEELVEKAEDAVGQSVGGLVNKVEKILVKIEAGEEVGDFNLKENPIQKQNIYTEPSNKSSNFYTGSSQQSQNIGQSSFNSYNQPSMPGQFAQSQNLSQSSFNSYNQPSIPGQFAQSPNLGQSSFNSYNQLSIPGQFSQYQNRGQSSFSSYNQPSIPGQFSQYQNRGQSSFNSYNQPSIPGQFSQYQNRGQSSFNSYNQPSIPGQFPQSQNLGQSSFNSYNQSSIPRQSAQAQNFGQRGYSAYQYQAPTQVRQAPHYPIQGQNLGQSSILNIQQPTGQAPQFPSTLQSAADVSSLNRSFSQLSLKKEQEDLVNRYSQSQLNSSSFFASTGSVGQNQLQSEQNPQQPDDLYFRSDM